MADIYGQLVKAQLEHSTSDLSNVSGLVYYKSDTGVLKYYDGVGAAWRAVCPDPTTTRGDLIRRGASTSERFVALTDNRVVRGDGTDVILGQIDDPDFFTTGAAAGVASIGIVTTAGQTFNGLKTFDDGIAFTQTGTATGTTTAATLGHYEEGTWTPTITATSGVPTAYTVQVGRFTRIGRVVFYQFRVAISGVNTLSGGMEVAGLPFTAVNTTHVSHPCTFGEVEGVNWDVAGGDVQFTGYVNPNTTKVSLTFQQDNASGEAVVPADVGGAMLLLGSGFYIV